MLILTPFKLPEMFLGGDKKDAGISQEEQSALGTQQGTVPGLIQNLTAIPNSLTPISLPSHSPMKSESPFPIRLQKGEAGAPLCSLRHAPGTCAEVRGKPPGL